jgi:hypothetical protein
VDPVPDALLLRKSGKAENRTRDLCLQPGILTTRLQRRKMITFDNVPVEKQCFVLHGGSKTEDNTSWKPRQPVAFRVVNFPRTWVLHTQCLAAAEAVFYRHILLTTLRNDCFKCGIIHLNPALIQTAYLGTKHSPRSALGSTLFVPSSFLR